MASDAVLIDAGPLVALCNPRDSWHDWVTSVVSERKESLLTCDAVISEANFILSTRSDRGVERLCGMLERGLLRSEFALEDHLDFVLTLMRKYRDLPASFADACLVAMADADPKAKIFTVEADFKLYRKRNRRVLPLIFPG